MAKKCAKNPDVFSDIHIASRTLSKCQQLQRDIRSDYGVSVSVYELDADVVADTVTLLEQVNPDIVINMALPYQDLAIMDACLETKTPYMDTANYEPKDEAKFCYKWQWDYHDRFKDQGNLALLGCGFDPGVTNIFIAYANKHYFDEIHEVDIVDCNAGDHGHPFATNFNPEINIREVTQKGKYYQNGEWVYVDPLSVSQDFDFPEVGMRKAYLLYHEELESLVKHFPSIKRIRFWMTFSEAYITHLNVLQNVGMTRIDPIEYGGQEIIPLQFLKAVLPDPSSLGENYEGKTSIGCIIEGIKNGEKKRVFIYNVSDHRACYNEVKAQAVSYTTGVPAMIGAMMVLTQKWSGSGVFNVEQMDPDPFMEALNHHGLPWHIKEL